MFRLPEKIRREDLGVGGLVREDSDLARARKLVDSYDAENLALRFVDILVTRPDDFVHFRHRLGSERHRSDGLRTAHPENTGGAREMCGVKNGGMHVRRGTHDDFGDPGHFRGNDGHLRRGQQGIAAAGHVASDASNGDEAMAEVQTRNGFDLQFGQGLELRLRELGDALDAEPHILEQLCVARETCSLDVIGRDFEGLNLDAVELARETLERGVAFFGHSLNDAGDAIAQVAGLRSSGLGRPLEIRSACNWRARHEGCSW